MTRHDYAVKLTIREGLNHSINVGDTKEVLRLVTDDCEEKPVAMINLLFRPLSVKKVEGKKGQTTILIRLSGEHGG